MTESACAAIGIPGQPWGEAERALWRTRQVRHRSYADDVLAPLARLPDTFERIPYGAIDHGGEHFELFARYIGPMAKLLVRRESRNANSMRPMARGRCGRRRTRSGRRWATRRAT